MAIKKFKPTTPSRRFMSVSTFEEVTTTTPERSLLVSKNKSGGRNANGRITVRHIGGGNRVKYRIIDFKRDKDGIPAKVATIEYDPNRSANIATAPIHAVPFRKSLLEFIVSPLYHITTPWSAVMFSPRSASFGSAAPKPWIQPFSNPKSAAASVTDAYSSSVTFRSKGGVSSAL